ncbi:MAG: ATP-binding protein [Deltaproteobacteria bacterium]|nr:ATP-binding protein [Deltaproteobacteria bacterium]
MAIPTRPLPPPALEHEPRQSRRGVLILAGVMLGLTLLTIFMLNYKGYHNWKRVDGNLFVFVVININIVLLTAVFYMLLRNLFKLFYERRVPLAAVGLKTKLIIAFVALSLPSTAFHLMTSVFMATQFETWSQGEYRQVTDASRVVMHSMDDGENRLLHQTLELMAPRMPKTLADYQTSDWKQGLRPPAHGAVIVYNSTRRVVTRWVTAPRVSKLWTRPPPQYFDNPDGFYWNEWDDNLLIRRLLIPIPDSPDGLSVEVLSVVTDGVEQALNKLDFKEDSARFLRQDLFLMSMTILFVMAVVILFAATWIAFYVAKGFVTPVEKLAEATLRVSGGELGWQVEENELGPMQGDFQELVRSFNRMSTQLKEQRLQLTETTDHLRKSHRELGEHARFIELLLENLEIGILSFNEQGAITILNKAAHRLLNIKKSAVTGQHFGKVVGRMVVKQLEDMLAGLTEDSRNRVSSNLTLLHGREPVHIEMTMLPLEEAKGGRPEGMLLMVEDVTSMQRTQRAEAWREVAKRVAHEIKNPLTPIQLSAQRLRRKYMDQLADPGVLDQCTETIINEVSSLKKMVNEFSQFAKLPERKARTDDLNQVIREVAKLYESGLPDPIRLVLDLDNRLPTFPLDREQIKRVFSNLIDNASAAIRGQGEITVTTQWLEAEKKVVAQVADNGEGVPPQVRERLFEPYTSTKEGGTGLGLTISNQIVLDHNGQMRYAPNDPKGSLFFLELPVG